MFDDKTYINCDIFSVDTLRRLSGCVAYSSFHHDTSIIRVKASGSVGRRAHFGGRFSALLGRFIVCECLINTLFISPLKLVDVL